ncbi:MAG: hypothetical protein Q4B70_19395 [Lachnospiraceae bacterium]|nr:hypothetical protein [Lachnospiraceae bacterium]
MKRENGLPEQLKLLFIEHLDESMKRHGFSRRYNSLLYSRQVEYGRQVISVEANYYKHDNEVRFIPCIECFSARINKLLSAILETSNNDCSNPRYSQALADNLLGKGDFISVYSLKTWKSQSELLSKIISTFPTYFPLSSLSQNILAFKNILEYGLFDDLNAIKTYADISSDNFIYQHNKILDDLYENLKEIGKDEHFSNESLQYEKALFFSFGAMVILKEYVRAFQFLDDLRCLDDPRYYDFRSVAKEYIHRLL